MHATRADVITHITQAIEAAGSPVDDAAAEYDLDGIADATFEYSAELQGFVQTVDTEGFWAAVEAHATEEA
ncbi:hypothetical protein [Nesterenkonia sp. K-15-9-6]|uniref:hypothetical protein n=1 Tax=Nesterenkonia sp. K-15-9-6 TaxID=3093918 RepID=UPI004043BA7A